MSMWPSQALMAGDGLLEEFVMAASEAEAEERAREQFEERDAPESIDGETNLVDTEETDE